MRFIQVTGGGKSTSKLQKSDDNDYFALRSKAGDAWNGSELGAFFLCARMDASYPSLLGTCRDPRQTTCNPKFNLLASQGKRTRCSLASALWLLAKADESPFLLFWKASARNKSLLNSKLRLRDSKLCFS